MLLQIKYPLYKWRICLLWSVINRVFQIPCNIWKSVSWVDQFSKSVETIEGFGKRWTTSLKNCSTKNRDIGFSKNYEEFETPCRMDISKSGRIVKLMCYSYYTKIICIYSKRLLCKLNILPPFADENHFKVSKKASFGFAVESILSFLRLRAFHRFFASPFPQFRARLFFVAATLQVWSIWLAVNQANGGIVLLTQNRKLFPSISDIKCHEIAGYVWRK